MDAAVISEPMRTHSVAMSDLLANAGTALPDTTVVPLAAARSRRAVSVCITHRSAMPAGRMDTRLQTAHQATPHARLAAMALLAAHAGAPAAQLLLVPVGMAVEDMDMLLLQATNAKALCSV